VAGWPSPSDHPPVTELPFTSQRRVGFGECDPARIYFAPRAFDYAFEAAEAWHEAALGLSFGEIARRFGLTARAEALECEYRRPLLASQTARLRVAGPELEGDRYTLGVSCEVEHGKPAFEARATLALAAGGRAAPIPAELRGRMEGYRARHGGLAPPAGATAARRLAAAHLPGGAPRAAAPFVRDHRVLTGECGHGGTLYPPRAVEHAVEAVGEWYERCLGISWLEQTWVGLGTPFVHIRCELFRPMPPGTALRLTVAVPRLGNASIGYDVLAHSGEALCFDARLSACHVSQTREGSRPRPFPPEMRERILAYQRACGGG